MCLAVPLELLEKDGNTGKVRMGSGTLKVDLTLVPDAVVGDYVVVHAGCAIEKLDVKEAEETLKLLGELAAAAGN